VFDLVDPLDINILKFDCQISTTDQRFDSCAFGDLLPDLMGSKGPSPMSGLEVTGFFTPEHKNYPPFKVSIMASAVACANWQGAPGLDTLLNSAPILATCWSVMPRKSRQELSEAAPGLAPKTAG